ncbi:MAG: hypothetical protein A2W91_01400 [Bacteroidetes bacterium GWF2_38_335]|nr:MAG: hypothetical protein A2W91_01400 [Bacteroidetes bacterium GWF2_38_335]OFY80946.1 MAG: hypothetical protein A2281_12865 [Bacteroidetes bacterium RIFOXYA12_FULL_38_20]HBS85119.1 glycosyl transferase family 2 [Bacteroidales bacterium]
MDQKTISVVISVYNEEKGLPDFGRSLVDDLKKMPQYKFEILWVNDGSTDKSQKEIDLIINSVKAENTNHTGIEFSKNYGHEAAMIAGIDHSTGDAVICMDADGQHPPSKLGDMIKSFLNGSDIVLTERTSRNDAGFFSKIFSGVFYRFLNSVSTFKFNKNSTDFFLVSRQVATVLRENFRENNRFIRGYIQSVGFTKDIVSFEAPDRQHGKTHYSFKRLLKLAINAVFSFSDKPLRLAIVFSALFILFTLVFGAYSLYAYFFFETPPSGYTTIVLFLSFSFSVLFSIITVLSLYFEKALHEIRKRPIYIVKSIRK